MFTTNTSIQQGEIQLGKLLSANMNTTGDQSISIGNVPCRITKIVITNASTSLSLAVGGFYTAASKGGNAIVANTQVYSSLTSGGLELLATLSKPYVSASPIYFALTTALGSAGTADIYVFGVQYL